MERWSISHEPGIFTSPTGEWVSFADAQALARKVAELEAELEVARSLWQPPCLDLPLHQSGCCSCHGY